MEGVSVRNGGPAEPDYEAIAKELRVMALRFPATFTRAETNRLTRLTNWPDLTTLEGNQAWLLRSWETRTNKEIPRK